MSVRVLVVDDEPMLVRVLVRLLNMEGICAEGALNGVEALARLEAARFDLVLCDVRMPVMDGPSLLRALRERDDPTRVVFLTGYADNSNEELLALGASAIYGKPLEPGALLEIIARWAEPAAAR